MASLRHDAEALQIPQRGLNVYVSIDLVKLAAFKMKCSTRATDPTRRSAWKKLGIEQLANMTELAADVRYTKQTTKTASMQALVLCITT